MGAAHLSENIKENQERRNEGRNNRTNQQKREKREERKSPGQFGSETSDEGFRRTDAHAAYPCVRSLVAWAEGVKGGGGQREVGSVWFRCWGNGAVWLGWSAHGERGVVNNGRSRFG